jgi:hypothetical protein
MTDAAAVSDRSHTFDIDMSTRDAWSWLARDLPGASTGVAGLALLDAC